METQLPARWVLRRAPANWSPFSTGGHVRRPVAGPTFALLALRFLEMLPLLSGSRMESHCSELGPLLAAWESPPRNLLESSVQPASSLRLNQVPAAGPALVTLKPPGSSWPVARFHPCSSSMDRSTGVPGGSSGRILAPGQVRPPGDVWAYQGP